MSDYYYILQQLINAARLSDQAKLESIVVGVFRLLVV